MSHGEDNGTLFQYFSQDLDKNPIKDINTKGFAGTFRIVCYMIWLKKFFETLTIKIINYLNI